MPKKNDELILPIENKYSDEHIWARIEGNEVIIGVSDYAQDQLGEVVFVELPAEGDTFAFAEVFGEVESIKSVNKLFMPISGKITAVNSSLEDTPTLLNSSCYKDGWIIKAEPDDISEMEKLMSAEAYRSSLY